MNYVCGDNRFEIIERYKKELTSATNIEGSPDEMAVLDNILFRFWQMGWLKEQEVNTGKWIEKTDYMGDTYYDCSVCGESWTTIDGTPWQNGMNYCPHCGAKMET